MPLFHADSAQNSQFAMAYAKAKGEVHMMERRFERMRRHLLELNQSPKVALSTPKELTVQKSIESRLSKVINELQAEKSRNLPVAELKKLQNGISEQVGKLFELRQQTEESQWEKASDQLNEIRKRLDDRKKNREAIIQKRVDQLLADED